MSSISLPNLPKGKEFEEYISAFFQSGGNYIERNIIEREVEEILELDIIATDYDLSSSLAILKNAVDYKFYENSIITNKINNNYKKILELDRLPSSFRKGLNTISKHKYFHKYPVFWQWFMWIFGGFILKDYESKEYEILSKKTGIPIEEIQNAFDSYQILFPRKDDGWFMDLSPNSNIKMMKMFPVPFMGIGANYKKWLYTKSRKFEELNLTKTHTLDDLFKWNNLIVEVLNEK
ncbi:MAG: hypothetical protein KA059_04185 [Elusimicrobiales bacterium]|nr:hypothetical protein [Elusimicrobiales bacterium]